MQVRFFSVPASGDPAQEDDLNRFLRSHRVLAVHREFVVQGENSFWALAVEYLDGSAAGNAGTGKPGGARVDYKQILSPEDFTLFVRLQQWRKSAAEEEGVPVYTIFTNEQLAEMARLRPRTKAELGAIQGVGEGRLQKYGEPVLQLLRGSGSSGEPGPSGRLSGSDGDPEEVQPEVDRR